MKRPKKCCVLIATVVTIALRLPGLEQRPMHGDEAVHAVKFGELLEKGDYRYNPDEYHGPTLNYLTLMPAWLGGTHKFGDLGEFTLRIVPVFFGVCLVLMPLLLVDGLGWLAVIIAVALTAVSPAFVFYSRYYIHEMLLVCFTFGVIAFGYRYTRSRNIIWALLTGACLGLMHATKETCIIAFGSMFSALLLMLFVRRRQKGSVSNTLKAIKPAHCVAGLAAAAIVSALFYSSFLTSPSGILDSFRSYTTYLGRAGNNTLHIHPWYYYLKVLIYSTYAGGPVWTEALIVLLAVVGFIVAMTRKGVAAVDFRLLRFIAFYTLIMTVLYSAVPYKTPWCLLGLLHGMILLAAVGMVALTRLVPNVLPRLIVICLLVAGSVHLTWQAYLGSYRFYADTSNPYVCAHPTTDVVTIAQRVEEIAQVHRGRFKMRIDVICPGYDYWPLPWYLRRFEKESIGWWDKVSDDMPAAPVIIASPSVEPALMRKLYELPPPGQRNLYVPLFDTYTELRPRVELRGYVRKDLWDSYQQHQAELILSRTSTPKKVPGPQAEVPLVKSDWSQICGAHRFCHEAMATTFEVIIVHDDARYAQQAALAAFNELDRLEAELSRFIENSDVARISNLAAGRPLRVGLSTFECLRLGARIHAETNGAFDVTIGSLLGCWLNDDKSTRMPSGQELNLARQRTGMDLLKLDEAECTVELLVSPMQIDLGGIGKGYAVDKMSKLLRDWNIDTALIHGGYSSVLALGAPSQARGWLLTLSNPDGGGDTLASFYLKDRAVSGSSLERGRHIIDPRTARPVEGKRAAWASTPDAATADALSTAFMVMTPDQTRQYCLAHPDVQAMLILEERDEETQRDTILQFGQWNDDELPGQ